MTNFAVFDHISSLIVATQNWILNMKKKTCKWNWLSMKRKICKYQNTKANITLKIIRCSHFVYIIRYVPGWRGLVKEYTRQFVNKVSLWQKCQWWTTAYKCNLDTRLARPDALGFCFCTRTVFVSYALIGVVQILPMGTSSKFQPEVPLDLA